MDQSFVPGFLSNISASIRSSLESLTQLLSDDGKPENLTKPVRRGRGRPRKYPLPYAAFSSASGVKIPTTPKKSEEDHEVIPREEQSYTDIYGTLLNVDEPIRIELTESTPPEFENRSVNLPPIDFVKIPQEIESQKSLTAIELKSTLEHNVKERIIEYDMDEIDLIWLTKYNEGRDEIITEDMFEKLIDSIELEWKNMTGYIHHYHHQNASNEAHEDKPCDICGDNETNNSNAIVFCDGCNVAVHQECYGVPHIPEGPWLCRKCMLIPTGEKVRCIFCPKQTGAFKQTTDHRWGHLFCCHWIDEICVSNTVYQEPIDHISKIPKARWKLQCFLCKRKTGGKASYLKLFISAPIQCSSKLCRIAYHATCAREANLYMDFGNRTSYCPKHSPDDHIIRKTNYYYDDDSDEEILKMYRRRKRASITESTVAANDAQGFSSIFESTHNSNHMFVRALMKAAGGVLPVIPWMIYNRLLLYHCKELGIDSKNRKYFLLDICKYWSLKRELKKGVGFVKRYHPYSVISFAEFKEEYQKSQYESFKILRQDLEKLRLLCELSKKREREKLRLLQLQKEILSCCLYPHKHYYHSLVRQFQSFDKKGIFAVPVSPEMAPDYHLVVKNPMDFSTIKAKINENAYAKSDDLKKDLLLMCNNALLYNNPETVYYKFAGKLKSTIESTVFEKVKHPSLNITQIFDIKRKQNFKVYFIFIAEAIKEFNAKGKENRKEDKALFKKNESVWLQLKEESQTWYPCQIISIKKQSSEAVVMLYHSGEEISVPLDSMSKLGDPAVDEERLNLKGKTSFRKKIKVAYNKAIENQQKS